MKKNIFYALACLSLLFSAPALAVEYSKVISDMPLIDGMVERSEQGVTFDKPDGRILKTAAESELSTDAVLAFYRTALPALGWTVPEGAEINPFALTYTRKGEYLIITTIPVHGKTAVSFNIIPTAYIAERGEAAQKELMKKQGQKQ